MPPTTKMNLETCAGSLEALACILHPGENFTVACDRDGLLRIRVGKLPLVEQTQVTTEEVGRTEFNVIADIVADSLTALRKAP